MVSRPPHSNDRPSLIKTLRTEAALLTVKIATRLELWSSAWACRLKTCIRKSKQAVERKKKRPMCWHRLNQEAC